MSRYTVAKINASLVSYVTPYLTILPRSWHIDIYIKISKENAVPYIYYILSIGTENITILPRDKKGASRAAVSPRARASFHRCVLARRSKKVSISESA